MSSPPSSPETSPLTPTAPRTVYHPFAHSKALIEVIPQSIDIEEESRLYEDLCHDEDYDLRAIRPSRAQSPVRPPSIFSKQSIWLDNNVGRSLAFARDVRIAGWTNVGDKLGGAYIVYDCVIRTREDTTIHAHKRYSAFVQLRAALQRTLPNHLLHFIPELPPKNPLARYRPTFLDRRRRLLEYWLSSVLLHPDIGACQAVRQWVMD